MGVKVSINGFDDLLKQIEKANGDLATAAEKCVRESAEIMQNELKASMVKAKVDDGLIERMPNYTIERSGTKVTAHVGYPATEYNPRKPSDYFKALFANYGTPHRRSHGIEKKRNFVANAKKSASKKIKAQQEKTLNDIMKDLTK